MQGRRLATTMSTHIDSPRIPTSIAGAVPSPSPGTSRNARASASQQDGKHCANDCSGENLLRSPRATRTTTTSSRARTHSSASTPRTSQSMQQKDCFRSCLATSRGSSTRNAASSSGKFRIRMDGNDRLHTPMRASATSSATCT